LLFEQLCQGSTANCRVAVWFNYDTGGIRRIHLRGHENIFKRLIAHVAGHNLGLLMRKSVARERPEA